MSASSLAGIGVLLTRPRHQAADLAAAIEAAGGRVHAFPVIDIVPRAAEDIARDADSLPDPDIVVFISRNAVDHGLRFSGAAGARIAAIGPATRDALEAAGQPVHIMPRGRSDSEHLLAAPELADVAGLSIRIVRGGAGRELLAATLRERGARVDYLSVYDRRAIRHSREAIVDLEAACSGAGISRTVVMSVDSLRKLLECLPQSCMETVRKTPLVTPSERVIQTASELLPDAPLRLAAGPGPQDLVEALSATATANPR